MKKMKNPKVAIIQAEPILFDKEATLSKAISLIEKASKKQVDLIVFPELFIPGYPYGMNFGFKIGCRKNSARADFKRYYDNSISIPSKEIDILEEIAKKVGAYISIGISEKDENNASLYNTNLIFSPEGKLVYRHRKLKPTGSERLIYADANKDYLPILDTEYGKIGSLICWESYMLLARFALLKQGISILISPNTNDNQEWQDTIKHIAIEGHIYYINCNMLINKSNYPKNLDEYSEIEKLDENLCRGGSCIIDPYGHYLTEPVWDKEEIIYAELDMAKVIESRMEFDQCGHYNRPDIFDFSFKDI